MSVALHALRAEPRPRVSVSPRGITLRRESSRTASVAVQLLVPPEAPVVIKPHDRSAVGVALRPRSLTFDASNWSEPQRVFFAVDHAYSVRHATVYFLCESADDTFHPLLRLPSVTVAIVEQANCVVWSWGVAAPSAAGAVAALQPPHTVDALAKHSVTHVSAGVEHSGAVTAASEVHVWGNNHAGQLGQQRDLSCTSAPCPVPGMLGRLARVVACGDAHTLVVTEDALLFGWGANDHGQLGMPDAEHWAGSVRGPVPELPPVVTVECGARHTLVMVAGAGSAGQLGLGAREDSHTFVTVPRLRDVKFIAAGDMHSAAATAGQLFTWGWGENGRLGHGDAQERLRPTSVRTLDGLRLAHVACGGAHTLALTQLRAVYAWGAGGFGQLGLGTTRDQLSPAPVTVLNQRRVAQVAAGAWHSAAVTDAGVLLQWGFAMQGQLGLAGHQDEVVTLPRIVRAVFGTSVIQVACGRSHTVALALRGEPSTRGLAAAARRLERDCAVVREDIERRRSRATCKRVLRDMPKAQPVFVRSPPRRRRPPARKGTKAKGKGRRPKGQPHVPSSPPRRVRPTPTYEHMVRPPSRGEEHSDLAGLRSNLRGTLRVLYNAACPATVALPHEDVDVGGEGGEGGGLGGEGEEDDDDVFIEEDEDDDDDYYLDEPRMQHFVDGARWAEAPGEDLLQSFLEQGATQVKSRPASALPTPTAQADRRRPATARPRPATRPPTAKARQQQQQQQQRPATARPRIPRRRAHKRVSRPHSTKPSYKRRASVVAGPRRPAPPLGSAGRRRPRPARPTTAPEPRRPKPPPGGRRLTLGVSGAGRKQRFRMQDRVLVQKRMGLDADIAAALSSAEAMMAQLPPGVVSPSSEDVGAGGDEELGLQLQLGGRVEVRTPAGRRSPAASPKKPKRKHKPNPLVELMGWEPPPLKERPALKLRDLVDLPSPVASGGSPAAGSGSGSGSSSSSGSPSGGSP